MCTNFSRTKIRSLVILLGLLAGYAAGCNPSGPTPVIDSSTPTPSPIRATVPVSTSTQTVTRTPAWTATATPRPTNTRAPSPTKATPTPSLTPLPTLIPKEADAILRKMVEENGGCRFPCVWGITPGVTSWTDAEQFLASFAQKIEKQESGYYTYMVVSYRFSDQDPEQQDIFQVYVIVENRIEWIALRTKEWEAVRDKIGDFDQFKLNNILSTYGIPDDVSIQAYETSIGSIPFRLILTYQQQGIFLMYDDEARRNADQLISCLRDDHVILYVWDPKSAGILDTILSRFEFDTYRPLAEVTKWSNSEFYEYFKDSRNAPCLETPAKYW